MHTLQLHSDTIREAIKDLLCISVSYSVEHQDKLTSDTSVQLTWM